MNTTTFMNMNCFAFAVDAIQQGYSVHTLRRIGFDKRFSKEQFGIRSRVAPVIATIQGISKFKYMILPMQDSNPNRRSFNQVFEEAALAGILRRLFLRDPACPVVPNRYCRLVRKQPRKL
jgi:hypothetical protein